MTVVGELMIVAIGAYFFERKAGRAEGVEDKRLKILYCTDGVVV